MGNFNVVRGRSLLVQKNLKNSIIKSFAQDNDIEKEKGKKEESPEDKKVAKVMAEFKAGTLKSSSGDVVTDHKQAIAIALSEADELVEKSGLEFDILKAVNGDLEKAKGHPDGTIKVWSGERFVKQNGKWVYQGKENKGSEEKFKNVDKATERGTSGGEVLGESKKDLSKISKDDEIKVSAIVKKLTGTKSKYIDATVYSAESGNKYLKVSFSSYDDKSKIRNAVIGAGYKVHLEGNRSTQGNSIFFTKESKTEAKETLETHPPSSKTPGAESYDLDDGEIELFGRSGELHALLRAGKITKTGAKMWFNPKDSATRKVLEKVFGQLGEEKKETEKKKAEPATAKEKIKEIDDQIEKLRAQISELSKKKEKFQAPAKKEEYGKDARYYNQFGVHKGHLALVDRRTPDDQSVWSRKPIRESDIYSDQFIDYNKISAPEKHLIDMLVSNKEVYSGPIDSLIRSGNPPGFTNEDKVNEGYYIVEQREKASDKKTTLFLVRTEGADYPRYITRLTGVSLDKPKEELGYRDKGSTKELTSKNGTIRWKG